MSEEDELLGIDYFSNRLTYLMGYNDRSSYLTDNEIRDANNHKPMLNYITDDLKNTLVAISQRMINHHNLEDIESGKTGERVMFDQSGTISGNFFVYDVLDKIVDQKISIRDSEITNEVDSLVADTIVSNTVRNLSKGTKVRKSGSIFENNDERDLYKYYMTVSLYLEKIRDDSNRDKNKSLDADRRQNKTANFEERFINIQNYASSKSSDSSNIVYLSLGIISCLKINNKWYITTLRHYSRLIKAIQSTANLVVMMSSIPKRYTTEAFIIEITKKVRDLALVDTEFIGESMKATRQIFIYKLETDPLISDSPLKDYLSTLSNERRSNAKELASVISSHIINIESRINISNIYKFYPHPDCNIYKVFKSIEGITKPNKCSDKLLLRFDGTTRRSLYKSLKLSGYDIRLQHIGPLGEALAANSRKSRIDMKTMMSASHIAWSSVKFEINNRIPKAGDLNIKARDKASQKDGPGDLEEMEELFNWSMKHNCRKPKSKENYGTVNDGQSELDSTSKLDSNKCIPFYKSLIKKHEKFEARYPESNIEDIPTEDFVSFLTENPDARTIVGTEPKLGEYHKKYTRMFYLAEQRIKGIGQRAERLSRLVSRKQTGVSIVKTYEGKQRDLEIFCRAMSSSKDDTKTVFISFDLSEFSKKFPMVLVRRYGSILAELTGEDWLGRLDLIFRSAMILHNTRGYFSHFMGALGGFEGFLNFLWSSCHAIIMEIALEAIALSGQLLTFSDDGLLYFITPAFSTKSYIKDKVDKIQRIYSMFGLEFNLKKTFVSAQIWEYLGDVCHDNRLLDMFTKEVSTFGRNLRGKGLTTVSDTFDKVIGQARSCIKSGFSPNKTYFLLRISCVLKLNRLDNNMSKEIIESLLITPRNCGGLRIPSSIEMMSSSTVDRDSEFLTDILRYSEFDSSVSNRVIGMIYKFKANRDSAIDSLVNGTRFKTSGLKTSGTMVTNLMIEEIVNDTGKDLATNPLTDSKKSDILKLLGCFDNIDPNIIKNFIQSLSSWDKYNSSISLVKSGSATRLLSRSRLRYYQSMDTRLVRETILKWRDFSFSDNPIKLKPFIKYFATIFLSGIKVVDLKPSARYALVRVSKPSSSSILVTFSPNYKSHYDKQYYLEPKVNFPHSTTTLGWMSEDTSNSEIRSARKMLDSISSVLSYNPDTVEMFNSLANIFNIILPAIPSGLLDDAKRRSVGKQRDVDISVWMPKYFNALSEARFVGAISRKIFSDSGCDRRTYPELARCISCIEFDSIYESRSTGTSSPILFHYNIIDGMYEPMFKNPIVVMTDIPPDYSDRTLNPVSKTLSDEFSLSFVEHINSRSQKEKLGIGNDRIIDRGSVEYEYIKSVRRSILTGWIQSSVNTNFTTIAPIRAISENLLMRNDDIIHSILVASYLSIDKEVRKTVSRTMITYKNEFATGSKSSLKLGFEDDYEDDYFDEDDTISEDYKSLIELERDKIRKYVEETNIDEENLAMKVLVDKVQDVCHSITPLIEQYFDVNLLNSICNYTYEKYKPLLDYICTRTLVSESSIFIVKPKESYPGKISEKYASLYGEVYTNTITTLYSVANILKWNHSEIGKMLPQVTSIDKTLDIISVQRAYVRASQHRGPHRPVNRTTELINMSKFYSIIEREINAIIDSSEVLGSGETILDMDMIRTWNIDLSVTKAMVSREIAITGEKDLGSDHTELLSENLASMCLPRVGAVIRSIIRSVSVREKYTYKTKRGRIIDKFRYILDSDKYERLNIHNPEEIKFSCIEFYNRFITQFCSRVVEIPSEIYYSIPNSVSDVTNHLADVFDGVRLPSRIEGYHITTENNSLYQTVTQSKLIPSMLSYYLKKFGYSGAKPAGIGDESLIVNSSTCYSNEGVFFSKTMVKRNKIISKSRERGIMYGIIISPNVKSCVENFLYISSIPDAVASIVRVGTSSMVVYITSTDSEIDYVEHLPDEDDISDSIYETMMTNYTFDQQAIRYRVSERAFTSSFIENKSVLTSRGVEHFQKILSHGAGQVISDETLIACKEISSMEIKNNSALAVYCLFYMYTSRNYNSMTLQDAKNEVKAYLAEISNSELKLNSLAVDINKVYQWFSLSQFNYSIDYDESEVKETILSLSTFINSTRKVNGIHSIITLDKPKNLSIVMNPDTEFVLGSISKNMFDSKVIAITNSTFEEDW